jgi:hypothetical protein
VPSLTDSPAEGFGTGKKYSAPPSNNHTVILLFEINDGATAVRGGLSYWRRRNPLIPSSGGTISCSGENIPCFNLQGIRVQDIEINT